MFAYCGNNPVSRKDASGTEDVSCEDFNEDSNPLNDLGNPTGRGGGSGSTWQAFWSTLHHAAKGLQMASGQRNPGHIERHHVLSNKNKIYTPQFKEITDRYNMSLSAKENIISLPGHNGRHTNAYHDFMLSQLQLLDTIAAGSQEVFTEGFGIIKEFSDANPGLPYAK